MSMLTAGDTGGIRADVWRGVDRSGMCGYTSVELLARLFDYDWRIAMSAQQYDRRLSVAVTVSTMFVLLLYSHTAVNCQTEPPLLLDNFFIIADSNGRNLYQVDYYTGATQQLLVYDTRANPFAVAYDPVTRHIFWSDVSYKTIKKMSLQTKRITEIFQNSIVTVDGLAIDPERQKLYYTDYNQGQIGEMSTDGSNNRILFTDPYTALRAIVLDKVNRVLYWTDWSELNHGIYRSPIDNFNRTPIIRTGIRWPNALTIDFDAGEMYWGDGKLDVIERSNLDGSGRVVLLNESATNTHYVACVLDSQFLYFTDWTDTSNEARYIRTLDRRTLETSTVYSAISFYKVNGIVLFVNKTHPASTTKPVGVKLHTTVDTNNRPESSAGSTMGVATAAGTSMTTGLISTVSIGANNLPFAANTSAQTVPSAVDGLLTDQELIVVLLTALTAAGLLLFVVVTVFVVAFCRMRRKLRREIAQRSEVPVVYVSETSTNDDSYNLRDTHSGTASSVISNDSYYSDISENQSSEFYHPQPPTNNYQRTDPADIRTPTPTNYTGLRLHTYVNSNRQNSAVTEAVDRCVHCMEKTRISYDINAIQTGDSEDFQPSGETAGNYQRTDPTDIRTPTPTDYTGLCNPTYVNDNKQNSSVTETVDRCIRCMERTWTGYKPNRRASV